MKNTTYKTNHARVEQAFCAAPGLFVSLTKPLPEGMHLDVTYETTDNTFTFFGRALGVPELRAFQAVLALVPISGPDNSSPIHLLKDTETKAGQEHLKTLALQNAALDKDSLVVKTTFYELAKEIGYGDIGFHSGAQIYSLKKSLESLCTVSVIIKDKNDLEYTESAHIFSRYQATKGGHLTVAINPRLAEGIMGKRKYSRLDMGEIRALKTDYARLIHHRLCGFIDPGKSHKLNLDTLCGYVWHKQALNINTIRKHKQFVKKALKEFEALGWNINEYANGKFNITRRATPN